MAFYPEPLANASTGEFVPIRAAPEPLASKFFHNDGRSQGGGNERVTHPGRAGAALLPNNLPGGRRSVGASMN
jgi:hypothetical protein